MKHTEIASGVYSALASLMLIRPRDCDANFNLNECHASSLRAEENFHSLINGYHTNENIPIVPDQSVNQMEAVDFLMITHPEEFVALMHQALYTSRILETAFEEMGNFDKADTAHYCRRQLVKAGHAYFSRQPIEG